MFSSSGLAVQYFLEDEFECTFAWLSEKRLGRRALCHFSDPCWNPKAKTGLLPDVNTKFCYL